MRDGLRERGRESGMKGAKQNVRGRERGRAQHGGTAHRPARCTRAGPSALAAAPSHPGLRQRPAPVRRGARGAGPDPSSLASPRPARAAPSGDTAGRRQPDRPGAGHGAEIRRVESPRRHHGRRPRARRSGASGGAARPAAGSGADGPAGGGGAVIPWAGPLFIVHRRAWSFGMNTVRTSMSEYRVSGFHWQMSRTVTVTGRRLPPPPP